MKYIVGDIGNTLTKICLLNNNFNIINSYNIQTSKILKSNNLSKLINKILKKNINKKILFSSVVPNVYKKIKFLIEKKNLKTYEIKDLNIKDLIKFKIKKFNELGSDRIANAVASFSLYKTNCLVIDFGTATTFDIILKSGSYEGGVIAPGVKISINNLKNSTALLPDFQLKANKKKYGKNTKEALNAGFLWGYQGLINNIIKKISINGKRSYKIILTGGYANLFKKFINKQSTIDKNITIKGIIKIYRELL
ncbi:MAG: type III pantothenate kinase [Candidatus Pelagibacter sp. TMED165]|nr:MAG: type III pantothenate kinase [Candidatus Pelagibacter sp. TMED165]